MRVRIFIGIETAFHIQMPMLSFVAAAGFVVLFVANHSSPDHGVGGRHRSGNFWFGRRSFDVNQFEVDG